MLIAGRKIDLSQYEEKDLIINNSKASSLSLQYESNGGGSITVLGKTLGSSDYMAISGIDSFFDIFTTISDDGIYTFNIAGIEEIKIDAGSNTSSIIYIRTID